MAVTYSDLGSAAGLKKLDEYLLTRSVTREGCGVTVEGFAPAEAVATPPAEDSKAVAAGS
ncbi:elongation factor 1-delta-like protein [Corchorus olitorius]|uniref:Elongation factor 1-delta-like protein n=1 Tax=Corchorus olitorius TaxID=93759 RepID=A0A1R3J6R9_9ROSI|nr:elongation factor 1-delta-like protein [Corchorus olitorius]